MKGLRERKQARMKQNMLESAHKPDCVKEKLGLEMEKAARRSDLEDNQVNLNQKPGHFFLKMLVFCIF